MAPNAYISTYQGDFGGRKSQSFSFTGKQGPSLVARQGEKLFEKSHLECKIKPMIWKRSPPLIMIEMKLNRLLLTLLIKKFISNDDQLNKVVNN